jgi:hypothetical protein
MPSLPKSVIYDMQLFVVGGSCWVVCLNLMFMNLGIDLAFDTSLHQIMERVHGSCKHFLSYIMYMDYPLFSPSFHFWFNLLFFNICRSSMTSSGHIRQLVILLRLCISSGCNS